MVPARTQRSFPDNARLDHDTSPVKPGASTLWEDRVKKLLLGALLGALSVASAEAAGPLDAYLCRDGDCYARDYDTAHLRDHPRQMVESFYLGHHDSFQDPSGELTLQFGFTFRNGRDYEGMAICQGMSCRVDGDGGAFKLSQASNGLRLDVDGARGMAAEGSFDFVELSETDDTVFLLYPAPARQCRG
jgi:hypothetical protein